MSIDFARSLLKKDATWMPSGTFSTNDRNVLSDGLAKLDYNKKKLSLFVFYESNTAFHNHKDIDLVLISMSVDLYRRRKTFTKIVMGTMSNVDRRSQTCDTPSLFWKN